MSNEYKDYDPKELIELLDEEISTSWSLEDSVLKEKALKLEEALEEFGIRASCVSVTFGPTVIKFEMSLAADTKISKVMAVSDDIQMVMAALSIRIEAPIPGKKTIGIEIPRDKSVAVRFKRMLEADEFRYSSPLNVALGRDVPGRPIYCDLAKMPHLLIAGATGSGKTVCLNSIITSLICKATPDEVKLILFDPKVVDLSAYNGIPHLLTPVIHEPAKLIEILRWAVEEMTIRYSRFSENGVRDLKSYNEICKANDEPPLPLIVIIVDEFADIMMIDSMGMEDQIQRLAPRARAAGIHLILATQRPSSDVITETIKNNIPARISLAVRSADDSRLILGRTGADKLLGRGDMLFFPPYSPVPIRLQGPFVSDKEVERVCRCLRNKYDVQYNPVIQSWLDRYDQENHGEKKEE